MFIYVYTTNVKKILYIGNILKAVINARMLSMHKICILNSHRQRRKLTRTHLNIHCATILRNLYEKNFNTPVGFPCTEFTLTSFGKLQFLIQKVPQPQYIS